MANSREIDNLIDKLYPEPNGTGPVHQAQRINTDKPQFSVAQSYQFGNARLRGYDLVVSSYNDPGGRFHSLGVLTQSLMMGRYGLVGELEGTQLTIQEAGKRVGLTKNQAQWRIDKALRIVARRS